MENFRVALAPTSVPEWNAEDQVFGVLSNDQPLDVDDEAARAILEQTNIELPQALDWNELIAYAQQHKTALEGMQIAPDGARFDFYLIEVPLTLILPEHQKMVRLRLELALHALGATSDDAIAYDLFPTTHVDVRTIMSGEASLDVSQALQFVLLAGGPGAALAPAAKCFGLKLDMPFKWTSSVATVQSSARMSNPVRWSLTDDAIQNGFSATAIVRIPKGVPLSVDASLTGEIRQSNPFGFTKTQFASLAHTYRIS